MLGPEHGTPAVGRKTVAIQIDDVDIAGPIGNAFTQYFAADVHEREETALDDLLIAERASRDAVLLRYLLNDLLDHRRGTRGAIPGRIVVEAGLGLLTQTTHFHQYVCYS